MPKDDSVRLRHMLDAAREAVSFVQGRTRVDLDRDRMLVLALTKSVEIIGEAAYQLSPTIQEQLPAIPWDDIVVMRYRLVHAYFDINLDILWRTVEDDLPSLIEQLQSYLDKTL